MENKLKNMFEYQRFQNNPRLAKIIADTESRYGEALSDDDLFSVNAAGTADSLMGAANKLREDK